MSDKLDKLDAMDIVSAQLQKSNAASPLSSKLKVNKSGFEIVDDDADASDAPPRQKAKSVFTKKSGSKDAQSPASLAPVPAAANDPDASSKNESEFPVNGKNLKSRFSINLGSFFRNSNEATSAQAEEAPVSSDNQKKSGTKTPTKRSADRIPNTLSADVADKVPKSPIKISIMKPASKEAFEFGDEMAHRDSEAEELPPNPNSPRVKDQKKTEEDKSNKKPKGHQEEEEEKKVDPNFDFGTAPEKPDDDPFGDTDKSAARVDNSAAKEVSPKANLKVEEVKTDSHEVKKKTRNTSPKSGRSKSAFGSMMSIFKSKTNTKEESKKEDKSAIKEEPKKASKSNDEENNNGAYIAPLAKLSLFGGERARFEDESDGEDEAPDKEEVEVRTPRTPKTPQTARGL